MKKILHNPKKVIQSFCILCLMLLFSTLSWGQTTTTVFSETFGSAAASPFTGSTSTPSLTYTAATSTTGTGGGAISRLNNTTGSDYALQILPGDISGANTQSAGITQLSGALSSFATPFNTTLSSNPGDITWFFHMKTNRSSFPISGFTGGNYGGGTVLAGTTTNLNTGDGYAVIFEKINTAVGSTTTSSTSVTLNAPNTGIVVGQTVTGTGLAANSKVASISGVNLVLSTAVTSGNSSRNLTFTSIASGTTTSGSTTITLVDSPINSKIVVGQTITGSGIPANATVASISGTTLTLSASATATASSVALTIGGGTTIKLVRFTGGLQAGTRTNLIVPTSEFFVDSNKSTWAGIKVVYTPSTNTWSMSLRNDGLASASPSTSTSGMTLAGTVEESTYTSTPMSAFGFLFNHGALSSYTSNTFFFDNFSCTVASTNPTVTLPTVASITSTSATLGATVTAGVPAALTSRGTLMKTASGVTFSDNLLADGSNTGTGLFTHSRTGLTPETLYYYTGYATNVASTSTYAGLSTESSFRTLSSPPTAQASSMTATGVSSTQVDVAWSAATFPSSGATAKQYLLLRATSPNSPEFTGVNGAAPTVNANTTIVSATVSSAATTYSASTGLDASTTYNFKLIPYTYDGTNAATYNYLTSGTLATASGSTTAGAGPTLSAPTATSITTNSAVLGATIDSDSGSTITDRGTVWSTVSPVTVLNNLLSESGTSTGAFSHSRTGFSPQTQYFYKGYASNGATGLSVEGSFRTLSNAPTAAATSFVATAASGEQINLSWAAATFPGSGATTKGYVLLRADYPNVPTLSNANATAPVAGYGTTIVSSTITSTATTASSTGLSGLTRYNYVIIPFAWDGVNAATYNYFSTDAPIADTTTLSTTPSTQPTSLNYSDISCNVLTVNWTSATGSLDGYIVLQTSGASAPDTTPSNGTTYSAGATLGNATVAYVGNGNSVVRSGLADNTTYNYKIYSYKGTTTTTSYLTTSPLSGSQSTTTAEAPIATTATSIYSNAFMANWNAPAACANSYLLDVATTTTFSANGTIAAETFENALTLFTSNGVIGTNSNFKSGNTLNSSDRPLNTPYFSQGTYAYAEYGSGLSTPVELISSDINTSAFSNVQMSFKLASISVSSSSGGNDATDDVTVSVSADGGTTYYPTVKVNGSATGNSVWSFAESGTASTTYDGNATAVTFSGASINGISDGDGYSTVIITGLPSVSTLKIKIAMKSSTNSENWVIDDFKVTGDASSFSILSSYNGLAVAGTSQQVTGLSANTPYYYRVRAIGTNGNSTNSNVISVTTLAASAPTLTSPTVSAITNTGAVLGATVSTAGSTAAINARGTVYKTSSPVTATDNALAEGSTGINSFTHSRTLSAQTQYYYAGYASNVSLTGLSSESSFYTLSNPPTAAASSFVATAFSGAQIDLSWTAASFPGSGATTTGYVLLRADYPTVPSLSNTNGQAPVAGTGTTIVSSTISGAATTASSSSLNGLTRYNYVIIPFTWNGSNAATYNYYTTSAPMADATTGASLATLPTNQPTALSFTAVTCNAITVNWIAATDSPEGYIVLRNSGSTAPNTDPVSSNTYSIGDTIGNATVAYIGNGASFSLSSLADATTYNFKIYSYNGSGDLTNYLTTSPLSGNSATNSVDPPTSSSASSITTTSFIANWIAPAACANSYLLEVSNNILFPTSATIAQENFENSSTLFTVSGGAFYPGNSGSTAEPASSPYFSQGIYGFGVTNGTATITSSNIDTSITSNAQLSFKLGAFGNGLNTGMDSADSVLIEVSPDGGTTYYPTAKIGGNGNANWPFTASGVASTIYDEDANPLIFTAPVGVSTTGYSAVTITGLPLVTNLKIRITLFNNATSERWVVDEFKITDTAYSAITTIPTTSNSESISSLIADTNYYYRVRAVASNSTSSNSSIITTRTLTDPTVANYRAKATGNFSNASTWEYANGADYIAATIAPTSSNSINIPSGKTVTMDTDFVVNSGKTFTVATSGTIDVSTYVVSGSGSFIVSSGATLKTGNATGISGSITTTSTSFNPAANYTFNGSISQTTAGLTTTAGTVTISNSVGVTLDANFIVNTPGALIIKGTGKLLFGSGTSSSTFNVNGTGGFTAETGSTLVLTNSNGIVNLSTTLGNIKVSGTRLFEDNVNYNFTKSDGINASNLGSAFGTEINATTGINNLTINNSIGAILNSTVKVNGALTLTSGNFSLGANKLTIGSNGTVSKTDGFIDCSATDSTIEFLNSSVLSLPASLFSGNVRNLTINGGGITLGSTTSLSGVLTITAGVLNTGNFLTLKSDLNGTARVATIPDTGASISGNVTVERYIPNKRAWRALTAPVSTTSSIYDNWQESGTTNGVNGLAIWSPSGGSGLTQGGSSNSLLEYDSTTNNTWSGINATNGTGSMMSGDKNKPFMAFVTGPYGANNITAGTTATTLRASGTLLTGTQPYTTVSDKYTFIGNPYASPLSLTAMLSDTENSAFGATIWVWDAKATGTYSVGAYNTYDNVNGTYTNITNPAIPGDTTLASGTSVQSGQAFFVKQSSGSLANFKIKETHKGTIFSNAVFKQTSVAETLRVGLYKDVNNEWIGKDGTMTVLFSDAEANQTPNKMANGSENVAFVRNGELFASEHHLPLVSTDTLFVRVWKTVAGTNYKLKINTEQFITTGLDATLQDLYTNANTALNLDGTATEYPFTVTADATSTDDRFRIVFSPTLSTPSLTVNTIKISPNPIVGDLLQVSLGNLTMGIYDYSITNALGQEIEKGTIHHNGQATGYPIRMRENLAAGIYVVKITGANNVVHTAKLIKQ